MHLTKTSVFELLTGKIPPGETVGVEGWVRTRRDSKSGLSFIHLSDGSCFEPIQIIAPNILANYTSEILKLTTGCSLKVLGTLVKSPGQGQAYEIQASHIDVVGWVENPDTYPISPKPHSLEYLREYAHLRPRTNIVAAMTRIQNCLAHAIHHFFYQQGFYWIRTPIITGSDCEGAGDMFRVSKLDLLNLPKKDNGEVDFSKDFFGKEVFLTVSGQLNVEAYCLALSKVYTFGPTFRAENSNTSRHLAEFWMIEPEIAFADLHDDALLAQNLLKAISAAVLNERSDDMTFFAKHVDKDCMARLETIINSPFEQLDYTKAIELLKKSGRSFEFPVEWGLDLQSEHERYLTEEIIGRPVIVMNYPKEIKAFYMRQNDDGKTVAAMDILVAGIGEIIGGSQREERLDKLDQRLEEMNLDKSHYWWYRDLRRYGSVPHAGFGLGFERFVAYVTGIKNIRDVIPYPRTVSHAEF